jgi:hypothetical protein
VRTTPLPEVAQSICGDSLKHPERWLLELVRAGKVSALRISRGVYHFTDKQVEDLCAYLDTRREPTPVPEPAEVPEPGARTLTLTPRSARTLRRVGGA